MNDRLEIASQIAAAFVSSMTTPMSGNHLKSGVAQATAQASLEIADALIRQEEKTALEAAAGNCEYCYEGYRCPWHRDENQPMCIHCGHPFYIHCNNPDPKGTQCVSAECYCPGYDPGVFKS